MHGMVCLFHFLGNRGTDLYYVSYEKWNGQLLHTFYIHVSVAKLHREVGACIHGVVYIVVPILSIVWFSLPVGSGMDINLIVTVASF